MGRHFNSFSTIFRLTVIKKEARIMKNKISQNSNLAMLLVVFLGIVLTIWHVLNFQPVFNLAGDFIYLIVFILVGARWITNA